jgi:CDP-glucose 4,6-dehydratase
MNPWTGRSVLVTGGNGFVGGWLVADLIRRGARVTALIRDVIPSSTLDLLGAAPKVRMVHGDAEDLDCVVRTLAEYKVEVIFHLAAQSQVGVANRSPRATIKTNIMSTLNVLEAARLHAVLKALVAASSDKAYGQQERLPYHEDDPLRGTYPYDASKACTDLLAHSYARTFGLPIAVTRCGNIFGPADINLDRLVPDTIRSLSRGQAPVIRSDGMYVRDYLFVADAVAAYRSTAEALLDGRPGVAGEAFNFGTNRPVAVKTLVEMLIKISGKRIKPRILNTATGEIREQYLSSDKALSVLGWKARVKLEPALTKTYRWYVRYFKELE